MLEHFRKQKNVVKKLGLQNSLHPVFEKFYMFLLYGLPSFVHTLYMLLVQLFYCMKITRQDNEDEMKMKQTNKKRST